MEESESKEGFKVSDKRRFTPEGENRGDEKSEASSAGEQVVQDAQRPAVEQEKNDSQRETGSAGQKQPPPPPLDFSSFILGMAQTALFQLGLIKVSDEQEPKKDLQAARQTIDFITLLEEKTRGNLTDAEKKILSETLFQLRIAFVESSK